MSMIAWAPEVSRVMDTLAAETQESTAIRFLFVKSQLAYPRSSGHDLRAFHMMRELANLGHSVGLVTRVRPTDDAVRGIRLDFRTTLSERMVADHRTLSRLSWPQARFASYFGVSEADTAAVT